MGTREDQQSASKLIDDFCLSAAKDHLYGLSFIEIYWQRPSRYITQEIIDKEIERRELHSNITRGFVGSLPILLILIAIFIW